MGIIQWYPIFRQKHFDQLIGIRIKILYHIKRRLSLSHRQQCNRVHSGDALYIKCFCSSTATCNFVCIVVYFYSTGELTKTMTI